MFGEQIKQAYQLIENGNDAEALAIFREVLTENPKNIEALTGSGYALYCLQEYAEAVKTLEAALLISPDDVKTHSLLGSTYYRLKDWYKAAEHHHRAVTLAPSTAEYHLRLYIDLHMLKEPELALSHLETAYQLDPAILGPRGKWKLWRARITTGLGPLAWLASWVFLGLLLTLGGQYSLNRLLDWLGNYLPLASTQSGQTLLRAVLMSVPFVAVFIYQLCKQRYRRAVWALILWAIWGVLVWYIPHRAGVW
jgi:tetratricopeptide (TPR) repeat protein